MRLNSFTKQPIYTHEGAPSSRVPPLVQLRRLTLACMLWEDTFYVDGKTITTKIEEACNNVKPSDIVDIALEAHQKGLLRHMPLFLLLQAIKHGSRVKDAIPIICNRPDQMTELLALYWKDGRKSIPAQMKKGLALTFQQFDEYQLAKYNRDTPVKLRDILFMCHAKPINAEQEALWKRLIDKKMAKPDTWETKLSAGKDKKESFEELLEKGKMGKLAIVRNLRNMQESGVPKELVRSQLAKSGRPLLPFQCLAAARMCPQWEDIIDEGMIKAMQGKEKLPGVTSVLVDVSGSMSNSVSGKSQMSLMDAACGLAILLRECCDNLDIFTFSNNLALVPSRHGMALRDAIINSQPHNGTNLGRALKHLDSNKKPEIDIERIIVITDEQSADIPPHFPAKYAYILNIAPYQNGIKNNGQWHTITGFSEASIDYIRENEVASLSNSKRIVK